MADLELEVFQYLLESVDRNSPEAHGAPAGLIAEELGAKTADVTRVCKKLAQAGLLVDTGYAMKRERTGRGYSWQFIERPKTAGGMVSKPGASTDWGVSKDVIARLDAGETEQEVLEDTNLHSNPASAVDGLEIEVLPAGELAAGVYVAQSESPAYAELMAMAFAGDAEVVGERYTTDGVKEAAFRVGGAMMPNAEKGQIRIGRQFYASALRDYSHDWPERWWREAVQNAVDAGATKVSCLSEQQADTTWLVSCEDDGRGMDEDTLLNRFLVLGGTTKVSGSTTGGFGKAKELLILPWISWEVHTRNVQVRGAGIEYEVDRNAPYLDGTRLSVLMPNEQKTTEVNARAFLGKCNLPGVGFTVNGERVKAEREAGKSVQRFEDKAELFYDENDTNYPYYALVRVNGLFMFEQYAYKKPRGLVVLELLRASTEILTANRDGIADADLKRAFEQFMGKLAIEQEVALRTQEGRIRKKFRGTGKFQIDEARVKAAMMERLGIAEPLGAKAGKGERILSAAQLDGVVEILQELPPPTEEVTYTDETGAPLGARGISLRVDPVSAKDMLSAMPFAGSTQIEVAVKQLSWAPDFYVVNEIAGFKVPKKYFPENMTAEIRKLARVWAELCRFVLIRLGCDKEYGVGFLFTRDALAEYVGEDREHWLMLNPFEEADPESEPLSISNENHYAEIFSRAVHECTHLAFNTSDHDKDFASALTKAIALTFGQEKQVKAIKRMVLAIEREDAGKRPKRERKQAEKKPQVRRKMLGSNWGAMSGGAPQEYVDYGPRMYGARQVYGNLSGVILKDRDSGQFHIEVIHHADEDSNIFRMPAMPADIYPWKREEALSKMLEEARDLADPDDFLLRLSEEVARVGTESDTVERRRWKPREYLEPNAGLKRSINDVPQTPLERARRRPADPQWTKWYDEARAGGASHAEAWEYADEEVRLNTDWGLQADIHGDE